MPDYSDKLNPDKALIFRIVHRDNVRWILGNGVHCRNSADQDPKYVDIGNADLISKRSHREVLVPPGGTLSDYVPFYFTPFSPMMYNIHTGRGLKQRNNDEIVILVSSLRRVDELSLRYLFTNAHAYPDWADYFGDLAKLSEIDWPILQKRDFSGDPDDPKKMERYQAEALIHRRLPVDALLGIVCYTEQLKSDIEEQVRARGLKLKIFAKKGWYF
ncbi:MAG: DUF4433 domain-containing protein [Betaproteobacteria bacterium]|nr:DUF4433 domain-containing protein [Betaproteobacteria bacterium]